MIDLDRLLTKKPFNELETVNLFMASLINSQLKQGERVTCDNTNDTHWYYWASFNQGAWLHVIHTYWDNAKKEIVIDPAIAYGLIKESFPLAQPPQPAQKRIREILDRIKSRSEAGYSWGTWEGHGDRPCLW